MSPAMARARPTGDGQPQTRAALAPAHGGLGLLELEEQGRQCVGGDADAGILDRDGDCNLVLRPTAGLRTGERRRSPARRRYR